MSRATRFTGGPVRETSSMDLATICFVTSVVPAGQVLGRDAAILEDQPGRVPGAHPHLLELAAASESRRVREAAGAAPCDATP